MKAIIFVSAKAALLEGLDNQGEYTIEFNPADLTDEQRAALAKCNLKEGAFVLKKEPAVAKPDLDSLRKILDYDIEIDNKIKQEESRRIQMCLEEIKKWTKQSIDKLVSSSGAYGWHINYPYLTYDFSVSEFLGLLDSSNRSKNIVNHLAKEDPKLQEVLEDAGSLVFWLSLEEKIMETQNKKETKLRAEEDKRKQETLKVEALAKEKRKADQIKAWVETNGTENQKLRYKDGFLSDQEIIDAIRADAYASLDSFNRYEKLTKSDVCEGDDEYDRHDVSFDVEAAEHLSADEYDALLKIKEAIPTATIEPRIHTAKCDDCETEVTRIGFVVRITVGEFKFSRAYGI